MPNLTLRCWCLLLALFLPCLSPIAHGAEIQLRARQNIDTLHVRLSISEQAWLRNKQSLVVGVVEANVPPYRLINQRQELEGIGADYLSALQRELAIPVRVKGFASRAAAYAALKAGQVDLLDNATQVDAEDYQVHLSAPYALTELALFNESGDLRDYARDMSATQVAASDGMALDFYTRTGGPGQIKHYLSPLAAMASILDGESDIYLGDTLATDYLSSQLFSNQLVVNHSARLPQIQVGFALAADNRTLQAILERTLGSLDRCQIITALALWGSTQTCESGSFRERLDAPERAWLDQAKPLQLVVSEDLAPYAFFNSRGRFNGIASDLLDIVRRKTGLRFEITRVTSLGAAEAQLQQRKADLSVLTQTHKPYLSTRPFVSTPYVLLRNKKFSDIAVLDQHSKGSLAFATGQALQEDLLRQYPRLHLQQTPTMGDALNLVRDGQVDFAVAPVNLARYYLAYKYESSLKINSVLTISDAQISFAATADQALLISIMDKALAEVPPQEYLRIIGRWRANSATDEKYWEGVASFVWKSLGLLCVLLAVAGYWIYAQRRRIIRKRQDLLQRQLILDQVRVAKESAEKASRSKSVFLATMSHEIRTPLNAIIGMLELVQARKDHAELNTRSVHIAYESAHSLLALIGDILDISRIESGKLTLHPQPGNLQELIESVANVFMGLAGQKHLSIQLELHPLACEQVWIDGLKFKQILSNLLSNAIKFTEHGGVVIQCQAEADNEHSITFTVSVTDTGMGIAASQLHHVFTPFFELDNAVNNPNAGAGLGLSISQSLSQLMDASLSVESQVDVGTCMTFKANLKRVSGEPEALTEKAPAVGAATIDRPLSVLIVEDHLPSQYLLEQQINYLGHQAIIANNGVEGLALWQEHEVDIILTDCNMPEMNGHDMTLAIRRMETHMNLRPCTIIGLTASAQQEELERCLKHGMSHALTKPIGLAALNQLVPTFKRAGANGELPVLALSPQVQRAVTEEVIRSNQQEWQALQTALEQHNRGALRDIAHKLKGTAYLINATELLAMCENLEELLATQAEQQPLNLAVDALQQALLALSRSLQAR